jgi:hypothetical protein
VIYLSNEFHTIVQGDSSVTDYCQRVKTLADSLLEPCRRNNPQVVGEIRAEKTHTTHVNIIELISFWCCKLGCIFWLYCSVYIDLLHGK